MSGSFQPFFKHGFIQAGGPANTPRILVSGCPQAVPNWKLHMITETAGAVIVGEESCVGEFGRKKHPLSAGGK